MEIQEFVLLQFLLCIFAPLDITSHHIMKQMLMLDNDSLSKCKMQF